MSCGMAGPTKPDEGYRIEYFFGRSAKGASRHLFKKVNYPGRSRAEVFVLEGERWIQAAGITPTLAGTPEWDGSATWVSVSEAEDLMLSAGLSQDQVKVLLTGKEGQRRWSRRGADAARPI